MLGAVRRFVRQFPLAAIGIVTLLGTGATAALALDANPRPRERERAPPRVQRSMPPPIDEGLEEQDALVP